MSIDFLHDSLFTLRSGPGLATLREVLKMLVESWGCRCHVDEGVRP